MRILIADDNQQVRQCVSNILAPVANWEVCGEAKDGREAIQMAMDLVPDILLLDMSMPGLSGLDAARAVREKVPTVKILIMSQHDPAVLSPRAIAAGAYVCIDKSRLGTDLRSTIESVEESEKFAESAGR